MGVPYYITSGSSCRRASMAHQQLKQSLTVGNHGPRTHCVGSSRTASKPEVPENKALAKALDAAAKFGQGCEAGITVSEMQIALSAIEVTSDNLPGIKQALINRLQSGVTWGGDAKALAQSLTQATSVKDFEARLRKSEAAGLNADGMQAAIEVQLEQYQNIIKTCPSNWSARKSFVDRVMSQSPQAKSVVARVMGQMTTGQLTPSEAGALLGRID